MAEKIEEVKAEIVKTDSDLNTENLPQDMDQWEKKDMVAYREKIRYAVEHGVLPSTLIDDKVNHKISETKLDEVLARIAFGKSLNINSAKLAIERTMVVNGSITIWGEALSAIIYQSGLMEFKEETFDAQTMTAYCTIKRKDMAKPETRSFSAEDAQIAGLWGKNVWAKYPRRMLMARARTYAFKDIFPDVLNGLTTTEEAQEIAQNDVMSDYSRALVQPVVKKAETVGEGVISIDYTPIETIQEQISGITTQEELVQTFMKVKDTVNPAKLTALREVFRQKRETLEQEKSEQ